MNPPLPDSSVQPGQRFAAIAIDLLVFVVLFVVMYFGIDLIYYYSPIYEPYHNNKAVFSATALTVIVSLPIYILKDLLLGKSPAKHLMQLSTVDNKSETPARPWQCALRNITFIIWPMELIVIAATGGRRIGDLIAGTKVVESKTIDHIRPFSPLEVFLPIAITILLTLVLVHPLYSSEKNRLYPEIGFDAESVNYGLGTELQYIILNKMAPLVEEADVIVFQNTDEKDVKLVSIEMTLKDRDILTNANKTYMFRDSLLVIASKIEGLGKIVLKGILYFPNGEDTDYLTIAFDGRTNPYPIEQTAWQRENSSTLETPDASTKILKQHYPNGQLESVSTYVNGKIDGIYRDWYPDGTLKTEIEYEEGNRQGMTTTYYPSGQKESEMEYDNNNFKRYINRWDENGNLIIEEE